MQQQTKSAQDAAIEAAILHFWGYQPDAQPGEQIIKEQAKMAGLCRMVLKRLMVPDKDLILPRFKQALILWVQAGIRPGQFLTAVLENNLQKAIGYGDGEALANLPHIVNFLYNECPASCWGDAATLERWVPKANWRGETPGDKAWEPYIETITEDVLPESLVQAAGFTSLLNKKGSHEGK